MYTLPLILVQVVILVIFTFVDPPKPTDIVESDGGGDVTRRIVCDTETQAFFILQIVFEAGMVATGCVLAYMQRNMDDRFGESKHLLVAMYNIALVSVILLIVISVADLEGSATKMLQAIGVLWGSVLSAAAFVVPRMIQIQQGARLRRGSGGGGTAVDGSVNVSGLASDFSGPLNGSSHNNRASDNNSVMNQREAAPSTAMSNTSGLEAISEQSESDQEETVEA